MPGHANTVSTTTVPVIKLANSIAEKVNGAMRAFFNACFQMIFQEPTPFAFASFTYSLSRTSSMEERVNLSRPAAGSQPSVATGST